MIIEHRLYIHWLKAKADLKLSWLAFMRQSVVIDVFPEVKMGILGYRFIQEANGQYLTADRKKPVWIFFKSRLCDIPNYDTNPKKNRVTLFPLSRS